MTRVKDFLTPRMEMIVSMAQGAESVCDIGTDHGYIAIALAEKGAKVIAADVNKGPLEAAKKNIRLYGVNVETRLSDGFGAIKEGEVKRAVIAGMGGELIAKIIERGTKGIESLVLQPQSLIYELRTYLVNNGFVITDEKMCREDNRFYTVMKVEKGTSPKLTEEELRIGPILLKDGPDVLKDYLHKEIEKLERAIAKIEISEAVTENTAEYKKLIEIYRGVAENNG